MKKQFLVPILLLLVIVCVQSASLAQAPHKMSYQAIIRDGSGVLIKSLPVGMKFSIVQSSISGSVVYEETQTITTNVNGVATAVIGDGSVVSGDIATIDWSDGPFFIKIDTDPTGGSTYTITSTNQLLSVPFALFAEKSGRDSVVYASTSGRDSVVYAKYSGRDSVIYATTSGRDSVVYAKYSGRDSVIYATKSGRDSVVYAKYSGRDSVVYAKFSGSALVDTFNWHLKGNAGTNPDSNFIGTTDDKDVVFKRNNENAGLLSQSNTSFGWRALKGYSTGIYNTAFGTGALYLNTTGFLNTAIGYYALDSNSTGNYNTSLGYGTLFSNKTGGYNTAIGAQALSSNNGSWNTAIGFQALKGNLSGTDNVAVGQFALGGNSTGNDNIGIGQSALGSNVSGSWNIALGYFANRYNTTGSFNVSLGWQALSNNKTGASNVALGPSALIYSRAGSNNVAIGAGALYYNDSGSYNTSIGAASGPSGSYTNLNNTLSLGYGSGGVSSASNRAEIGNTSMSWIGGQVGWSTYSDARIKKDIKADVPGLDFINKLRPVTYNLDAHRQYQMLAEKGKVDTAEWTEKYDIEKIRQTGFIAQEVATAAKESGYDFSGVEIPENEADLFSVRYSDFVMPLVKAVQEQQKLIESLEKRIAELETK